MSSKRFFSQLGLADEVRLVLAWAARQAVIVPEKVAVMEAWQARFSKAD